MMTFLKKKKSLAQKFSLFTIALILLQSVLLVGSLILGGVLKQSRENVYQSFQDKVISRAKFLQSEIDNRWTNIDPYVRELSKRVSVLGQAAGREETERVLFDMAPTLISMLRITGATGSFVILEESGAGEAHPALYFRNYDPTTNSEDNRDLYLLAGSAETAKHLRIPLDRTWQCGIALEPGSSDFYEKPYAASVLSSDYAKLEYWSDPFRLTQLDEEIITYTVPLFDTQGQVRGVMGVEVLTDYFKKLLPANELTPQDSLGYLMASFDADQDEISPLISKGGYQKRVLGGQQTISLQAKSREEGIYVLEGVNAGRAVYGCVQELSLYHGNAPYETKRVVLVGLMDEEKLMAFVDLLQWIFLLAFLGSLVLGVAAGVPISRKITAPIVSLAKKVRDYDAASSVHLERTGLSEIDELSNAIEQSNRNLLESTLRMSQIMDLLNVRIGAFECRDGEEKVLVTNQIFDILDLPQQSADCPYVEKALFTGRVEEITARPEPDEPQIYLARSEPPKWVKISLLCQENSTLGVVSDMTEEIREKHRIKRERDYDYLTKLYNRAAFQREVGQLLAAGVRGTAAMVMFDLDNLKQINDSYGHECGDIYIRAAAERLAGIGDSRAVAGRRSGDEFYLFFYGWESREEIRRAMDGFYQRIGLETLSFPNGVSYQVGVSSGISWYGEDAFHYDELVRHADFAMYEVKLSDKGRLGEFDPARYQRQPTEA